MKVEYTWQLCSIANKSFLQGITLVFSERACEKGLKTMADTRVVAPEDNSQVPWRRVKHLVCGVIEAELSQLWITSGRAVIYCDVVTVTAAVQSERNRQNSTWFRKY